MKLVGLFIAIFFASAVHASATFTYSETPEYKKPKLIDILEVQTKLEEQGYWPVDLSHDQKLQWIGIDQAFFDPASKKTVLLKFGMRVSDLNLNGQLLKLNGDYLFHGEIIDKTPFAIYFIDHAESEARAAIRDFKLKPKASVFNLFIPEAKATTCATLQTSSLGMATLANSALTAGVSIQRILSCGMNFRAGVDGSVSGLINGVKTLVSNPEDFWKGAKESWNQLKKFASHIESEVQKLTKAVGGLDTDSALQIGCTLAGELFPGLIVTGLTAGAGAAALAKATAALSLKIAKINKMSGALKVISDRRRATKLQNGDAIVDKVVSCAL